MTTDEWKEKAVKILTHPLVGDSIDELIAQALAEAYKKGVEDGYKATK
jgi:hypothetical protein